MTVNHDVVGSSPTAGVANTQLIECFFVYIFLYRLSLFYGIII